MHGPLPIRQFGTPVANTVTSASATSLARAFFQDGTGFHFVNKSSADILMRFGDAATSSLWSKRWLPNESGWLEIRPEPVVSIIGTSASAQAYEFTEGVQ